MNKKEKAMIQSHFAATKSELHECYNSWSDQKQAAFDSCFAEYMKMNGYDRKIPSHSTNYFSFSYLFDMDGKTFLRYHTAYNAYTIMLEG